MFRKFFNVAVLSATMSAPLLAAGCASGPNAVTGNDTNTKVETASNMTAQEKQRYTDSKGHFHTEWIGEPGR
jgi:hypothetical protein